MKNLTKTTPVEAILAKLVAIPTIFTNPTPSLIALDYIEHFLTERGMHCKRFTYDGYGSLVATTRKHRKKPALLLAGHVDVMPGGDHLFALKREDDKLIGRGVLDMKGGVAGYLQFIDDIKDEIDQYDLGVMIVTDEEVGGVDEVSGTQKLIAAGYRPESVVLLDGAYDWNVETLAKGNWRFDLTATGKTAHSSRPWEGESAAHKLIPALHEIQEHFKDRGRESNTFNIGILEGGEARNQIPTKMTAFAEVRIISEEALREDQAFIQHICARHGLTLTTRMLRLPVIHDPKSVYHKAFLESIQKVIRPSATYCTSFGASDADFFYRVGIPIVVTYPSGGGHHSEHEWINRDGLLRLPALLHDYAQKVARFRPAPLAKSAAEALTVTA